MFFFKQKTADDVRISDWSSDVCSSDLIHLDRVEEVAAYELRPGDDGLRRRDMLLQQVDAVARLLERRRRDIGRQRVGIDEGLHAQPLAASVRPQDEAPLDRKSTRLNSSH